MSARLIEDQRLYHAAMYSRLLDRSYRSGYEVATAGLKGLNQMGHFGTEGCDLIAEAIRRHLGVQPSNSVNACELGSGFGGAMQAIAAKLSAAVRLNACIGIDILSQHSYTHREMGSAGTPLTGSATAIPLATACMNVVYAVGSFSHFQNVPAVLQESRRVLKARGIIVFTEEVSLRSPEVTPTPAFLHLHPSSVFASSTPSQRSMELEQAGFDTVVCSDLTSWAIPLLKGRIAAIRVFRHKLVGVYGESQLERIRETLSSSLDNYHNGALCPRLIVARTREY